MAAASLRTGRAKEQRLRRAASSRDDIAAQPALRNRARAWLAANGTDLAIVSAITILAGILRLWRLGSIPLGLHGDEAWTGLDAQRILDEGWIGPYVLSALGQPTGPLYFTALVFTFMPDDVYAVRFSMAIFGVATIPLAYALFASMFNRTVGAFAAAVLCVMAWHLHLSRTGFMVTTQPFMQLLVLLALWHALQTRRAAWFVVAGALFGLGIYTYNAYTLFLPVPFVALAVTWFHVGSADRRRHLTLSAVFIVTATIVAIPMIRYVATNYETYHLHQEVVGLTDSPAWHDASIAGKPKLVWDRAVEWQEGLLFGDRPDLGDGLATDNHPAVDPLIYALALAGLVMALRRVRRTEYAIVVAAVLVLPWGALLTVDDGLYRRTLGMAPFIALFAALPLAWLWQRALTIDEPLRYAAAAAVIFIPAFAGARATGQYFGPVQDDPYFAYVYPYQLDAASHYMDRLPPGTVVYFYSDRWPFDYETRRFEAPEVEGADRSIEYRPQLPDGPLDFGIDRSRNAAFMFLGAYVDEIERAADRYGGGVAEEQVRKGEVLFRAYFVPAD